MEFTFITSDEFKNVSNFSKGGYLTLEDIDTFLNMLLKNAATRLSLKFDTLKSLVIENSPDFFEFKNTFFKENRYISISSEEFITWCNLLKIPVANKKITNIRSNAMLATNFSQGTTHKECIELFKSLSIEEKIKFIKAFEEIQIPLTPSEISKLFK